MYFDNTLSPSRHLLHSYLPNFVFFLSLKANSKKLTSMSMTTIKTLSKQNKTK